jgi:hypothetical protein
MRKNDSNVNHDQKRAGLPTRALSKVNRGQDGHHMIQGLIY